MLIIRSRENFSRIISVFLLAILLLAPLVFLHQLLEDLKRKDESYLEILARERLVIEMETIQELLTPNKYIEYALNAMHEEFGFTIDTGLDRSLIHSYNTDPGLLNRDFPEKAREYLKENYGIKPFLIISTDCDAQRKFSWYAHRLFQNQTEQDDFEEATLQNVVHSEFIPVNELKNTASLSQRKASFLKPFGGTQTNCQIVFSEAFRRHLSVFSMPPLYPDTCLPYFSNKFGNQRSFQYFHRITKARGAQESFLGGYYICFNSSDFQPLTILKRAIKSPGKEISRLIFPRPVDKPFFKRTATRFSYFANFPSLFHVAIEDSGLQDPVMRSRLRSFLQKNCLMTSIDAAQLQSRYATWQNISAAVIKLALLFLFAMTVLMLQGSRPTGLRLSGKLRIAVALIVMLPILGIFVVSELIKSNSEKIAIIKQQNQIKQRMGFLEKLLNDTDPRLVLILSEAKLAGTAAYFKIDLPHQAQNPNLSNFINNRVISTVLSLDKKGHHVEIPGLRSAPDQSKTRGNMFRVLADLNAADLTSPQIQSLQKQQLLMSSFTDAFSSHYMTGPIQSRESLINNNFLTFAPLKRACCQFLAHPMTPNKPEAILFFELRDQEIFDRLFKQLSNNAAHLFSDSSPDCRIDYGLFLRSPANLRNIQVPRNSSGINPLREIAARANAKRMSGSSVFREGDDFIINSWFFSYELPVIITARGKLSRASMQDLIFSILPLFLLIYAMLATALLSDTLADIFLAPVNTLLACVKRIQANQINVKAVINTGDEFEDLACSFNHMSDGLCQHQKMRRFVSEKLFKSLENSDSSSKAGKVNLTILSSDIRGFTSLSENHQPEEIVSLLNEYFSLMEKAICENGGSIEKIIGDAIVAAFYQDDHAGCHAQRACTAARAMKRQLAIFNQKRQNLGLFTIETGIGIATGTAVLGFAGTSKRRREFILLGEVIHNAEILESKTRHGIASRIFVDSATHQLTSATHADKQITSSENEPPAWELSYE